MYIYCISFHFQLVESSFKDYVSEDFKFIYFELLMLYRTSLNASYIIRNLENICRTLYDTCKM